MTQQINFSSVAGSLVPVFCDFLHPGEKISGHAEMITRTNELQTASFVDIDEYIEYFFVPAMKLNSIYGEWFFNIDDRQTMWRPGTLPEHANTLPNVSYSRLWNEFEYFKGSPSQDGEMTPSEGMLRLFQHFRYNIYGMFDAVGRVDGVNQALIWNIALAPFQAYQAIYYDYYRDTLWQNNDVSAYNTDDWLTSITGPDGWSALRLMKIFQMHQRRQNADYYTSMHPSPLQNATGMLDIDGVREATLLKLNQWLEVADIPFAFGTKGNGANTNVGFKPNVDFSGELSILGNGGPVGVTRGVSDYNTSYETVNGQNLPSDFSDGQFYPLPNAANQSDLWANQGSGGVTMRHKHNVAGQDVVTRDGQTLGMSASFSNVVASLRQSISSTAIRTMFALEKLAQITGRAGKHYDDQVFAHYGYKISSAYGLETMMIGQQHSTVHIGEIVSPTTVPDGSVAGEIVGKGYGVLNGEKAVDFTAPCHGYFMAIYSAVPRRVYTPMGNPKEYSQLYRFDFMQPELMNLGQQPLFYSEFSWKRASYANPIAGWSWRYMEDKTRVPMAIGALSRFSDTDSSQNGILQDWTIQYPVLNIDPGIESIVGNVDWRNFLVLPSAFNSIMLMQYTPQSYEDVSGHVARLFDRDPLFHKLEMKLYKTSYMSKFGEPRID